MFSDSVMISVIFTIIISGASIIVPLCALLFVTKNKEDGVPGSFGLGLLAYFWSQYLLPLPILMILDLIPGFDTIVNSESYRFVYLLITSVLLVTLASLGRVWCVWLMNKRTPSLYRAISSAVGFAAFTALSRIATYISYYKYMKLCNNEGGDALKSLIMANGTITEDNALEMIVSLKSASSFGIAMEGLNVVFMLVIEVALIAVVYEGFVCKKTVKATLISGAAAFVYSYIGMIINASVPVDMVVAVYNIYQFACALAGAWIIVNAVQKYKKAMAQGIYAQKAYFEK